MKIINNIASEVVVRSVFMQGLYFESDKIENKILKDKLGAHIRRIDEICKLKEMSMTDVLLAHACEYMRKFEGKKKGIILTGRKKERLKEQVDIIKTIQDKDNGILNLCYDLEDKYLADPRQWTR